MSAFLAANYNPCPADNDVITMDWEGTPGMQCAVNPPLVYNWQGNIANGPQLYSFIPHSNSFNSLHPLIPHHPANPSPFPLSVPFYPPPPHSYWVMPPRLANQVLLEENARVRAERDTLKGK